MSVEIPHSGQHIRRLFSAKELACTRYQRAVARAAGISQPELRVLVCVARHGEITPSLLERRVGATAPTLGATIARLLDLNLVARRPHPRDGRSSLLRVTSEGAALLSEEFAELAARIDQVYESLPQRDRATVAAFLTRVADASAEAATAVERRGIA